jgi:hypothetical protein
MSISFARATNLSVRFRVSDRTAARSDLRPGAYLEVIGLLETPDTMRAWRVIGFDSPGTRQSR